MSRKERKKEVKDWGWKKNAPKGEKMWCKSTKGLKETITCFFDKAFFSKERF